MKRTLALALCLLLLCALFPPAFAEEGAAAHECGGLVFEQPLEGQIKGEIKPGRYYLVGDCTVVGHVKIAGEVALCLNGHSISIQSSNTLLVVDGGVLSIYDCVGGGVIGHYKTTMRNNPVTVQKGGTVNLYGGWISATDGPNAISSKGVVNLYGGKLDSGWANMCALLNEGVVNLYGGELVGYCGISQRYGAELNLCGTDFIIDSKALAVQYVTEYAPVNLKVESYRWRTDPTGEFFNSKDRPYAYSNVVKYLQFEPLRYTISYELNGGLLEGDAPADYLCGEGVALPDTVLKDGFVFTGWVISDGGGIVSEIGPERSGNMTLWATYAEAPPQPESETADEFDYLDEVPPDPKDGTPPAPLFLLVLSLALLVLIFGIVLVIYLWTPRRPRRYEE